MFEKDNIIGLITYRIIEGECEIMSLDSLKEKQGILPLRHEIEFAMNLDNK